MDNKYRFIIFLWVSVIGFIVYKRTNSNTILLLIGIIISYIILYEEKKKSAYMFDKELTYWVDTLINAKTSNEKNRCYNIINKQLLNDSLLKSSDYSQQLLLILKEFEPTEPLEYNFENY